MRKRITIVAVVAIFILASLSACFIASFDTFHVSDIKALSAVENPTTGTCCPGGDDTCVIGKYEFDNRYYQAEGPCKKE